MRFLSSVPVVLEEMDTEIEARVGDRVELRCQATGVPRPIIRWFREGRLVNPEETEGLTLTEGGRLVFEEVQLIHEDVYVCEASNSVGQPAKANFTVEVSGRPQQHCFHSSIY